MNMVASNMRPETSSPYIMRLPGGRVLYVELPSHMTRRDRDGSLLVNPEGVKYVDRLRALAMRSDVAPSPAFIATVRQALGLTQAAFAQRLGKSTITIKRWEAGTLRPGTASVRQLRKVLDEATRRGVVLPA